MVIRTIICEDHWKYFRLSVNMGKHQCTILVEKIADKVPGVLWDIVRIPTIRKRKRSQMLNYSLIVCHFHFWKTHNLIFNQDYSRIVTFNFKCKYFLEIVHREHIADSAKEIHIWVSCKNSGLTLQSSLIKVGFSSVLQVTWTWALT